MAVSARRSQTALLTVAAAVWPCRRSACRQNQEEGVSKLELSAVVGVGVALAVVAEEVATMAAAGVETALVPVVGRQGGGMLLEFGFVNDS